MDIYLKSDEIAELCTILQAGLVPYSMAGDLGEEERKSACKNGIFTFTLEDPLLVALPENFDDNAEGWEKFFGMPGYTKVSHMLTVNNRSLRWTHDFTATQWKHDFKEVHEKQQQQVHVIQQDAASGIQNRANVDNALGSMIHHPGSNLGRSMLSMQIEAINARVASQSGHVIARERREAGIIPQVMPMARGPEREQAQAKEHEVARTRGKSSQAPAGKGKRQRKRLRKIAQNKRNQVSEEFVKQAQEQAQQNWKVKTQLPTTSASASTITHQKQERKQLRFATAAICMLKTTNTNKFHKRTSASASASARATPLSAPIVGTTSSPSVSCFISTSKHFIPRGSL